MSARDEIRAAADHLEQLDQAATPGPWRQSTEHGNKYGSVVSDTCVRRCDEWADHYDDGPPSWTSHPHDGYGGCLIGESMFPRDRALLPPMRNAAEHLPALLRALADEDPIAASQHALTLARAVDQQARA